ncbi:holo-ACP synthase [Salinimonas sp. HHU 13199]|uniref:Holo-[acyl-carrier-protein] synthase n=1 Tax=Salinimonas profundi TaxID=2729140 RepID=A0ABR8LI22_9ALTE|nr:holo-ACP synthase [Salinimonas profundi]MBD3585884.1 holo-ACP synthase [Salinimonas profundi]
MAIIGLGTDIVEIARIENTIRRQPRFVQRILTPAEQMHYKEHTDSVRYLAKRFAAKEAAAKALQTGIGRGVSWQHMQVENDDSGAPHLIFSQGALTVFEEKKARSCHLSISDEKHYAVATVIIES